MIASAGTARRATTHHAPQAGEAPPAALAAVEAYLVLLYGEQPGYMETWHGHTDPRDPSKIELDIEPTTRWRWYDRTTRAAIAALLVGWGDKHGNVYISSALYDRPARPKNGGVPRPSRVIFVDDAKAGGDLIPAARLSTSAGNGQHIYRSIEPMDPATRREMQARAAAALGCDKSGSDIEQLLRVPASFNTKHHGCYPVHVESYSEQTYSVDELRAAWPEVHVSTAPGAPSSIEWASVDVHLANIEQLVNPAGVPWRFKNPQGQGRRVIEGKVTPLKLDGTYDPSLARAFVTKSLRLHGYEETPAAAILLHLGNFHGTSNKGTSDLKADIARLIGKYWADADLAHVIPTPIAIAAHKPAQPQPDIPRASRARKDRPQVIDADGLLRLYSAHADDFDQIPWTRSEAARKAGVSLATIARLEAELRERRDISNRKRGRNGRRLLILNRINIPKPEQPAAVLSAPPAPEPAPDVATISSERLPHSNAENEQPRACVGEREHTAPGTRPPAAPAPTPPAPPPMFPADGPLTARDTEASDYAQSRLGPRPRPTPLAELPPEKQKQKLERSRGKVRTKAKGKKRAGLDHEVPALQRAAANIGEQLAALDAGRPPEPPGPAQPEPPPAEQLQLAPGPMSAPEAAPIPAACVSFLPAARDTGQVLPRPSSDYIRAVEYWAERGDLAKAWGIVDANSGRYNFDPERARLSAAAGATA